MTRLSKARPAAHLLENRLFLAATTASLSPVADSYVRDGAYASQNFGTAAELVTKLSGTDFNREAVLKFDLSATQPSITSAKLRLYGALQDTRAVNVVTDVYGT